MKKVFLLIAFAVTFAPRGFAQIASNCTPSPALINAYKNDVADMALQRLYETKSADTARIEILQIYQDSILRAMAGICNLGAQYEADSVFMNYCVHRYPYQSYMAPSIQVKVDTAFAWAKQWSQLINTTGYTALDQFLSLHGVRLTSYFCLANTPEYLNNFATLAPSRAINLKAFGDSLKKFPGVLYYYNGNHVGDGDRITYSLDSAQHFQFVAGRGDCPAGCTMAKIWKYTVYDCMVMKDTIFIYNPYAPYLNFYGYYPNCSLRPLSLPAAESSKAVLPITLSPNPVRDNIKLSISGNYSYKIMDAVGAIRQAGNVNNSVISVRTLQAGIYILLLADARDNSLRKMKFIRQ